MNTLGELFNQSVQKNGDCAALGFVNEKPYSYNDVSLKVNQVINLLDLLGVERGDKVAILSSNQPNWGVAYFAITKMDAVAVPILPDFHEEEVENVLSHSGAKALFISESLFRKVENISVPELQHRIIIEQFALVPEGVPADELPKLKTSLNENVQVEKDFKVEKDDLASIIYTSGTTGKSKGVMLTHNNLVFTAKMAAKIHHMDSSDRLLSVLPLSHTYENTIAFILPFMLGASIYYMKKPPTPSVLLPALKKIKPTVMLTVPLIIEKVYKGSVLPTINAKSITRSLYKFSPTRKLLNRVAGKKLYKTFGGELKFFGIGGAKLDPTVEQFLIEGKFPYAVGYGLTETAPLLAGFDSFKGKHQSTGPAMEGVTLKINNPDPVTGEGEIWAKGENVMKGYYKEPELTKEVLTEDGWFKTGDLGAFDADGYLFIRGRLKNMIVGASGENIYPEEIEAIINRFQYVLESVVVQQKGKLVAMVHFNMEELQKRFEDLKEQANQLIDNHVEELKKELQYYVNSRVNKFSKLQTVIFHAEPFEKTATKKIKRFLYY
ncbi:MAG: AMP-binding protein [Prolixibacteraceae bacterium]|nr:AMP-binding protein [Prolixibacteraceae bacterium]